MINISCMATYHPSRKLSKLDEPDTLDAAGEVRNTWNNSPGQIDLQTLTEILETIQLCVQTKD